MLFYIKSKQNAVKIATQNLKNLWSSEIYFGETDENSQKFLHPKISTSKVTKFFELISFNFFAHKVRKYSYVLGNYLAIAHA